MTYGNSIMEVPYLPYSQFYDPSFMGFLMSNIDNYIHCAASIQSVGNACLFQIFCTPPPSPSKALRRTKA